MAACGVLRIQRPGTMAEATADALIRYIAANRLQPGDRLPSERDLVDMAGVSRLPLREALCILKGLGVVEAQHGRGVFVKRMDMAAIFGMLSPLLRTQAHISPRDIVEVRGYLEPRIAELAARNRSPEHLSHLADGLAGMRDCLDDARAFVEHDMGFHQELARSSGNPVYHVFMAALTDLVREVQLMFPDRAEYREASIRYHEEILTSVDQGDCERAVTTMREHIRNVEERI